MRFGLLPAVLVATASAIEIGLDTAFDFTPLIIFHAATSAATWAAGPIAGSVTALLGLLIGERWFFANPLFVEPTGRAVVQAVTYTVAASAIVIGLTVLRGALQRAARGTRRAERLASRVRRRNAEVRRATRRYRALNEVAAGLLPAVTRAQIRDLVLGPGATAADSTAAILIVRDGDRIEVSAGGECPPDLADEVARSDLLAGVLLEGGSQWVGPEALSTNLAERLPCDLWAVLPLSARDRRIGALLLGYELERGATEADRTIAELLAQQCAQALDRSRLYQEERRLRIEAQFGERRLGFLALASAALAATLDTSRSLAEVADLSAANLGGFCAIHLVEDDGEIRLAAGTQTTEAGPARFGGEADRFALAVDATLGYPAVLARGQPQLIAEVDPDRLAAAARSPEHVPRLHGLGLQSMICVPLIVRDTVVGAITVASIEAGRRLGTAEQTLLEHVARRVAQAVDAARLYHTAVQASRAKSSFLAVMSHELRTPLNAILGYADLMLLGVPAQVPEEARHQVDRIRSSATHLLELVEDILSFARADSGQDTVRLENVYLEDVVIEAIGMVEPFARRKKLVLRRDVPADLQLSSDRAKLLRILQNLLSNATKFTLAGEVAVEARLDGEWIAVDVKDTGIGIPAEHRERIFDPFWQVEQTPARRFGGTGIGLGVARQLARLLGGDLTVESELEVGSTFSLVLPRVAGESTVAE